MAESIDTLQRQVTKLTTLLQAQQSGLPARLTVLVTGEEANSNDGIQRVIALRLKKFGLKDESEALEAGCEIAITALPWLTDRKLRKVKVPDMQDAVAV